MTRFLVACAAAAMTAACGGGSGGSDGGGGGGIESALQGTWMRCGSSTSTSASYVTVFSGAGITQTFRTYSTPGCTGTPTSEVSDPGTFVLGAAVTATVGGASVTAYQLDVTIPGFGTYYDLVYVDAGASPDRLYIGDLAGANDGTTPALRPTSFEPDYLNRQ